MNVIIRDKETHEIVKEFYIPDHVVKTLNDIGGLNMGNFFDYEIV